MKNPQFIAMPLSNLPEDLRRVFNEWSMISSGRVGPKLSEFDISSVPVSLHPFTMIKLLEDEPRAYRYHYYGSAFADLNGEDLTGQTTDQVSDPQFAEAIRQSLDDFLTQSQAQLYIVCTDTDREWQSFETVQMLLRLPLSSDGKSITGTVSIVREHVNEDRFHELEQMGS